MAPVDPAPDPAPDTAPDTTRLVQALREHTAGFARAAAGGEPDATVPTCPEWRLATLVGHIGQADRWAAEIVRTGAPQPIPYPREADPGPPGEWEGWLRAGAEELITAVGEADPGARMWSIVGPAPATLWLRRMFCETAIHHYDAALTTGAAYRIADDLAADVLTEGLEMMARTAVVEAFVPELARLRGAGERLGVRPHGMDGWLVTRLPEGIRWERGRSDGDVVVSGSMTEIMLVFARRVPPGDVSGKRALLDHWLANTAF
ncbi:maleylpyruvate isomerase family mycothiol-dependent enzyme [Nonomuraea sp. NPDC049709]|uniref:maleylpyruvate isomerase family mycothiol-dependent enzyme n=1 Tax=Nonomuraea sp. NPDC049709 TaxID=3154736 RepID=UPI00342AFE82